MNPITLRLVADKYIKLALEEDIHSEDVSTNAVMRNTKKEKFTSLPKKTASSPVFRFLSGYSNFSTKTQK